LALGNCPVILYALRVRLGILGPARGDHHALARAAQELLDRFAVERVIYLGADDALDQVVANWARDIIGADPNQATLFSRAAAACAHASADDVHAFVGAERARSKLRVFSSLPSHDARTIELLDGRVVLLVFDKATLDEEDIIGASLLVYGRAEEPLIRRVGVKTFVCPGPIGCETGGRAVLDDEPGGVQIEILDAVGKVTLRDHVGAPGGGARMKVQGG